VNLDIRVAEQISFGNTFTNPIQLVAVEGHNGDVIQREFQLPMMHNILTKEIAAFDVDNSLSDGRFVNFDYGSVIWQLF
jgi:hypothetical protein